MDSGHRQTPTILVILSGIIFTFFFFFILWSKNSFLDDMMIRKCEVDFERRGILCLTVDPVAGKGDVENFLGHTDIADEQILVIKGGLFFSVEDSADLESCGPSEKHVMTLVVDLAHCV